MELIRGRTLLEYSERRQLNARERLAVMAKICDAVEHAHQRGVIHRDLKPGNILVDETGQPKILDFGVARVTDADAQATRKTGLGQLVGTLANDLLAQAGASNQMASGSSADPDLKVRTVLDRASARIKGKFERQPEVEADIRSTIGETYIELGLYLEGRVQFEHALDLRRRALGPENPKTLNTMVSLGGAFSGEHKYPQAEALYRHALEIQRRVLGPEHPVP